MDIIIEIKKNLSNLEGPYKFNVIFDNNFDTFHLPSITFGKIKDELFVYCVQGEKEKQNNMLAKKLDRHFRKANKDVDMQDEMLSQVSVSALISLVIFLTYNKMKGIEKVTAYNFMPIRYNSNLIAGLLKAKSDEARKEFEENHDRNQYNITNRFFNTIMRYVHHFNLDIEYDDICEKLMFKLNNSENKNCENIVYDIEKAVIDGFKNVSTFTN